ncbi:alpha/beta hydrolase [Aquibium carbonis]|uniref:Alpha/beta hydrolase n=1 Tax=Aquibium carbonis TaxID=2495581 RepID=A0A3R9ZK64_9HYPH|nr:alpha/beta hydrolase [Aquibium carbonis]RST81716.1 alpha/beta hydrolase [Aquibium carbonis]
MPSFKSHLFAFVLKHTRKKSFASVEGMHARLKAARATEDFRPPHKIAQRMDIAERRVDGMTVYDVRPKAGATGLRIVYLHGGAYLFEITAHHWKLIAEMAERLSAQVTVPIYPLAPEAKAERILGAGMALYRDVVAQAAADTLVLMGDSAGANMALVVSMMAARDGLPKPAGLVLISPPTDLSLANSAIHDVEKFDPWLGVPGAEEATRLYADGIDHADWRISPLYGDLSVLSPMLLLTGTRDLLNPDTHLFAARARAAGVPVEVLEEPGLFNVWPLLDMPEAYRARDRMVAFIRDFALASDKADDTRIAAR